MSFAEVTNEGVGMPPKRPVTSSLQESKPQRSSAERRAAEVAGAAGRQAELKREAADRRIAREQSAAASNSANTLNPSAP
jgi:hypothetical protein